MWEAPAPPVLNFLPGHGERSDRQMHLFPCNPLLPVPTLPPAAIKTHDPVAAHLRAGRGAEPTTSLQSSWRHGTATPKPGGSCGPNYVPRLSVTVLKELRRDSDERSDVDSVSLSEGSDAGWPAPTG